MSRRRFFLLLIGVAGLVGLLRPTVERLLPAEDAPVSARPQEPRATDLTRAPAASPPALPSSPRSRAAAETSPSRARVPPSPPSPAPADSPLGGGGAPPTHEPAQRPTRHPTTREGIRAAIRDGTPGIRECYREWLKVQPNLAGRLPVTFTIDTDDGVVGRVEGVSLGDAGIGHLAMEGCVLSVFQELAFEAPLDGPLKVTYPVILAAPAADAGPGSSP